MVNDSSRRVTQAELARHLNVSRAAVNKAVKAGRITSGEDGLFDPEQAGEDWKNNTRSAAVAAKRSADRPKRQPGGQPKYASARARKEHHLANMAAIKEQEMLGRLVSRDVARYVLEDAGTCLRVAFEELSMRLAPQLYGLGINEMAIIIDEEVRRVHESFAEMVSKADGRISEMVAQKNQD